MRVKRKESELNERKAKKKSRKVNSENGNSRRGRRIATDH